VNKAERRGTHRSADAETRNKPERTGTDRNPFTALWTTVSGFESRPPSQFLILGFFLSNLAAFNAKTAEVTFSSLISIIPRCHSTRRSVSGDVGVLPWAQGVAGSN